MQAIAIVFILIGLALIAAGCFIFSKNRNHRNTTIDVQAEIVDKKERKDADGNIVSEFFLSFEVDGKTYSGVKAVRTADFYNIPIGNKIDYTCDKADPNKPAQTKLINPAYVRLGVLLGGAFAVVGIYMLTIAMV